mgnify:CR=1 FL=1
MSATRPALEFSMGIIAKRALPSRTAAKVSSKEAQGRVVICDRFTDSTRAYQGGGRDLDRDTIEAVARVVHGDLEPHLTLLLDLPVSTGLARASNRGEADRMEVAGQPFHERVRRAYLALAEEFPDRIHVIDASLPPAQVSDAIRNTMEHFHEQH